MDDYAAIKEISSYASAKARRAARKGQITRLTNRIKDYEDQPLADLEEANVLSLYDSINKEVHIYRALQQRLEELLEEREGFKPEDLEEEVAKGMEINDANIELKKRAQALITGLKHRSEADLIQNEFDIFMRIGDETSIESEKDSARLHKKLQAFIFATRTYRNEDIQRYRQTFLEHTATLATRVDELRMKRLGMKAKETTSASPLPPASRGSRLNLELPTFDGDPLRWQLFYDLFTSALERTRDEFSDREKIIFLLNAMTRESVKDIITPFTTVEGGYQLAIKELQRTYGAPNKVFPPLIKKVIRKEPLDLGELRKYTNKYVAPLRVMQEMKCAQGEHILAALAIDNFTEELAGEWRKRQQYVTTVPTVSDIHKFMEQYEDTNADATREVKPKPGFQVERRRPSNNSVKTSPNTCVLCKEEHKLFRCPVFLGYDAAKRQKTIKDKRGCTNCLNLGHQSSSCTSSHTCKECNGRHNTLLHRSVGNTSSSPAATNGTAAITAGDDKAKKSSTNKSVPPPTNTFLQTAMVQAEGDTRHCRVRVVLDSGATATIISEDLASKLRLKRHFQRCSFSGIGEQVSKHYAVLTLKSLLDDTKQVKITAHILAKLPSIPAPRDAEPIRSESHLQNLTLADPEFGGKFDVLLGGTDLRYCSLRNSITRTGSDVVAHSTIFGWTVVGPLDHTPKKRPIYQLNLEEDKLEEDLARLVEMDMIPSISEPTIEIDPVTKHFLETHSREEDGRYIVRLPRIDNAPAIGQTRQFALIRLHQNEKSLRAKGTLPAFNKALDEYVELDHAEIVPDKDMSKDHCYLPVHGVVKEKSTTTKMRPVFDASAKGTEGHSLNETLHQGPNLYTQLSSVIVKFRVHFIALSSDINKMFRELILHPDDRDSHRYLWRNKKGRITDLRMKRVTFGVTCSPYLATQALRDLANNNRDTHPEAAYAIDNSFYVDDLLSGTSTLEEAVHLFQQLRDLLSSAGMNLRKWRSSSKEFMKFIPEELAETENLLISPEDKPIKALGIHWNVDSDMFYISTPTIKIETVTKRTIASMAGKVYDILGLFAPVTVVVKMMLRKLWQLKLGWNTKAPSDITAQWISWTEGVDRINQYGIPRRYTRHPDIIQQSLHGFSDASQEAYGAVVYLRSHHADGTFTTAIVMAKARVMPIKTLTIPRAELEAARIMAKLLNYISNLLDIKNITAWTDSSIVLCWLRKHPSSLNVFVSNRITMIHKLIPEARWKHVSTHANPADVLSRGTDSETLVKQQLWWDGPTWLSQAENLWPTPQFIAPSDLPETKKVIMACISTPTPKLWDNYSSFSKLVRVTGWILRFASNSRKSSETKSHAPFITTEEFINAKTILIRQVQSEHYPDVIKCIKTNKPLPKGHPFNKYRPLLEDGSLHLATRVRDSKDAMKPVTVTPLPIKSTFTQLLIRSSHILHLHPSTDTLLTLLGTTYHIPGARNFLKHLSRLCPTCQRAYDRGAQQPMGLLPSSRTTPAPAFTNTGVDFAGPFVTRRGHTRKPVMVKAYACLFVCMTTKAVHIELCLDLTTEEFLAAVRRFCARRGVPKKFFSDNGSNFVGAANELERITELLRTAKDPLRKFSQDHATQWHFNPPRAPHMGGLWEASIKQMKMLMRKHIQAHLLKTDELASILVEIEAVLNSRPITPLHSTDPEDVVLTPGHFLIGRPLHAPPSDVSTTCKLSALQHWRLVERLQLDIWQEWSRHYLTTLHSRSKWNCKSHFFNVGDVVFLRDEGFKYRRWPLAKIVETIPGTDGIVRVVKVYSQGSTFMRDTTKLIPFMELHDHLQLNKAPDGPPPAPPTCSGQHTGST